MRHPAFIFAVILTILPFSVNAQGIVQGSVYDRDTNEPLPGVYVIYGKGLGTSTDNNGFYLLKCNTGGVSITFKYIGYRSVTESVNLNVNDTLRLNIGLEAESQTIDQIVVSADRMEQKMSELTVSMDIIKPGSLSQNHITDAQELIGKVPGIEVLDGQASIRGGSGFSYGVGSRVLALIDGLPMMSADAGGIKWNFLPLENLSQVEIIKGASSVMYGSSALNGVISFRSADASNLPVTQFFIETGIFDSPKNKDWKWWDVPRIFSNASFSHLRKIGNTDLGIGINLLADNSYRKYNDERLGRVNLRLKHRNDKVKGLVYGLNLSAGTTRKTDFILWENAVTGALKQDTSSVSRLNSRFFTVDPFISLSKANRFRHDVRMRFQSSVNRFPVRTENNAGSANLFGEYQFWYRISDHMNFTTGLSENWSNVTSNFFGDHKGINLAGFAQVEVRPWPRLKISGGLRIEQNILDGDRDKVVPVFRAGVNLQAAEFTFLRASFGQGYRYPSIAEKHASTTLGSVRIFPNQYIQAESGWTSEIGVKQGVRLGEIKGQADLSLFFSQNSDMIEYIFGLYPDQVTGEYGLGFQAANVEQSRVYGSELEFML
ncbi:MAG: TonB-dependent receptor, partial [Bacteroidia bacterium]